ncbi:MAG TPA: hypothetical protein VGH72_28220, partial [Pseudonocardia sp.]
MANPKACVVTAASAPEADTFVETIPRSTREDGCAGALSPQAAVPTVTTRTKNTAAAARAPQ